MISLEHEKICVIGLGYVGLPVALSFGRKLPTVGFDIRKKRVDDLLAGKDETAEVTLEQLRSATKLVMTADPAKIADCTFFIVAVPTPIDLNNRPDLGPMISASRTVGPYLKKGDIVCYESTVYPGVTEEICGPILARESGLTQGKDFKLGYSPERINPGDKEHTLTKILKVVSGDTPETLEKVAQLYERIIVPGVHRASSIKAAEAAKVIENTQRDLNIALMNELAIIFDKIGIDTSEVLEAAGTKWNFLKFKPGLVGGHCIGVDPYYLTHKADMIGYHPQVILAGRRINDGMAKFIAEQTIKQMIAAGSYIKGARVNVLGLTFKENCGDLRNSKVIDIINELRSYGVEVFVTDAQADPEEAMHEYGVRLLPFEDLPRADAIVAAVAHREYAALAVEDLGRKLVKGGAFIDVKAAFDARSLQHLGYRVWRL